MVIYKLSYEACPDCGVSWREEEFFESEEDAQKFVHKLFDENEYYQECNVFEYVNGLEPEFFYDNDYIHIKPILVHEHKEA